MYQDKKCDACGRFWDEQFIVTYERTKIEGNTRITESLHVCEECDHPHFDEEIGLYLLMHDDKIWNN